MKYERLTDEDLIIDEFYTEVQEDPDIRRIKSILLLLLAGELILALFYMAIKVYFLISYQPSTDLHHNNSVLSALVAGVILGAVIIIFVAIFLVVVVKNSRIGILIFAWVSVIDLILTIVIVILAIVGVISAATAEISIGLGLSASIFILIGSTIALLLTISIIVSSFELARLIKLQQQKLSE